MHQVAKGVCTSGLVPCLIARFCANSHSRSAEEEVQRQHFPRPDVSEPASREFLTSSHCQATELIFSLSSSAQPTSIQASTPPESPSPGVSPISPNSALTSLMSSPGHLRKSTTSSSRLYSGSPNADKACFRSKRGWTVSSIRQLGQ